LKNNDFSNFNEIFDSIIEALKNNSGEGPIIPPSIMNQMKEFILNYHFWDVFKDLVLREFNFEIEKQQNELLKKNLEITDSIKYALTIQRAILTSHEYFTSVFSDHFVYYQPKDIVSGDFYWAFKTKTNKIFWCTADCTGHGVPGAFMTMIGNALLNEIIIENGVEETNVILDKLRDSVIKTLNKSVDVNSYSERNSNGMDIALCCWDLKTNELTFSGAHSSVIIVRNGELIQIKGDRQPIGLHRKMEPFTLALYKLEHGDRIYTSSDGYTDQLGGPEIRRYSFTRLKELLLTIALLPMEEQKSALEVHHQKWKGNIEQIDDIVVVGILVG
jgi:serine phosphatase RsbU (regulator of sigma subunit)